MAKDIVENFHMPAVDGTDLVEPAAEPAAETRKIFVVAAFVPAKDRLLLKRMPAPKDNSLIARPQIAEEQSEYGFVVAVGQDVEVPTDVVAKFSKFAGAEEIHFEDELEGDEYLMAYKHDIRGWFLRAGD